MGIEAGTRKYSGGRRAALLILRLLTASFLTALIGAIANWFFELFFAPDLYAAGPPFARGVFVLVVSFPFIITALILLGLPITYALGRFKAESAFVYALAGAASGAAWGALVFGSLTTYGQVACALQGVVCALVWWWLRPRGLV
jgi:hypothetical protein